MRISYFKTNEREKRKVNGIIMNCLVQILGAYGKFRHLYHWMNKLSPIGYIIISQGKVYRKYRSEVASSISRQVIKSATVGCNEVHMTSPNNYRIYFFQLNLKQSVPLVDAGVHWRISLHKGVNFS